MNSKKLLALLLSALMLTSSFVACDSDKGKETGPVETVAPETDPVETGTSGNYTYNPLLITENGAVTSHIVVAEGADDLLTYAAEELVTHIKLVSGAEAPIVSTVGTDSLPIIIATPDSCPELEELFPDDLAWLRDLGDGDKVRWGSDGFAIRLMNAKLYIFGATPRGALNGVYDFIEDNMGVLWIRADESYGTIYDEMPTITIAKADYREKSPFDFRGWISHGAQWDSYLMYSRNKLNGFSVTQGLDVSSYVAFKDMGLEPFVNNHNVKYWIQTSPSYDPSCTEYWSTNDAGEHATSAEASVQVNYWSDVTVQCTADGVIAFLDYAKEAADIEYVSVCPEDLQEAKVYPEMTELYEYAPGKFTTPADENYISTVYFSFVCKVAAKVAEKYPDVKITTYAYGEVEAPPAADFEFPDNVYITYCPYNEDLCADMDDPDIDLAYLDYQHQLGWMELTSNIQVYAYYGDCTAGPLYERAIWRRMQASMQLYAANSYNGMMPEGVGDTVDYPVWIGWADNTLERRAYYTAEHIWDMNVLSHWIYGKLCWNPNEDIDALIDYYCEKVFGDAAPHMREYYRLLDISWLAGRDLVREDFHKHMKFNRDVLSYWDYFIDIEVDGVYIYDAICEALGSAWEAADDDAKVHIAYIKEIYDNAEMLFLG